MAAGRADTQSRSPVPAMPTRTPRFALSVAFLLAFVAWVPGGPLAVSDAFAAAPDGRLVVTWRTDAPNTLAIDGVASLHRSNANEHRAVVVASAGRAADVAARLRADPNVEFVVPDAIASVADWPADEPPDDTLYAAAQADFPLIGMPAAWTRSIGSTSVVVAILDTGYEGTHPDLAAIPTVSPYNARTGSTNVTDGYGHGTHVAGTIAAQTNNATGVAGMAPGVTIMPVKVMDSNGNGYWSDFLEGVDWARTHGASIVNLSLGGPLTSDQVAAFQPTFDAAYAAGVLVIAAAGNNNNSNAFYPASFAHVVSVAATNNSDAKASFSNYGPAVDLSAPGVSITSTYINATYLAMSGTSMATPHVVGLAALIRSAHPTYTVDEVETAMEITAKDLGAAGRDNYFGYGRIQAAEAVAWEAPDLVPPVATLASPANGATNVAETVHPRVGFSEDVTGADGATIALKTAGGTPIAASVSYDSATHRATITPAATLASRTKYIVAVGDGIADLAGNALAAGSFSFTTGDHIAPTVTAVRPAQRSTGVWRLVSPRIVFSEKVAKVSRDTIRLRNVRTGNLVSVAIHYDATTHSVTIDPTYRLMAGTWYRIAVRDTITDLAGNHIATRYFYFKTRY
jgi:subtilisin family serine protease